MLLLLILVFFEKNNFFFSYKYIEKFKYLNKMIIFFNEVNTITYSIILSQKLIFFSKKSFKCDVLEK